jgi:hypothetical protein
VRPNLGEPPLGELGILFVERPRDRELEDAVSEELEALVRRRAVRRPGAVREDVLDSRLGKLGDELRQVAGLSGGLAVTGAP